MSRISFVMAVVVFFTIGCATIKEKTRMSDFEEVSRAYEQVLLDSDFESAHGFAGPKVERVVDFTAYKDFKIVEYEVKKGQMSEDKNMVSQTVEMKYYRTDSLVVRTMRYDQLWEYDADKKTWLLQTDLPEFK